MIKIKLTLIVFLLFQTTIQAQFIQITNAKDALTSSQIIIRDNTGSVIQDINITDQKKGEIILNTSKWVSQIYFISLVLDNKVKSTQKIILQR